MLNSVSISSGSWASGAAAPNPAVSRSKIPEISRNSIARSPAGNQPTSSPRPTPSPPTSPTPASAPGTLSTACAINFTPAASDSFSISSAITPRSIIPGFASIPNITCRPSRKITKAIHPSTIRSRLRRARASSPSPKIPTTLRGKMSPSSIISIPPGAPRNSPNSAPSPATATASAAIWPCSCSTIFSRTAGASSSATRRHRKKNFGPQQNPPRPTSLFSPKPTGAPNSASSISVSISPMTNRSTMRSATPIRNKSAITSTRSTLTKIISPASSKITTSPAAPKFFPTTVSSPTPP